MTYSIPVILIFSNNNVALYTVGGQIVTVGNILHLFEAF